MRPRSGFVTAVPAALALVLALPASAQRSADRKIDSLLARITIEERLGQLNQLSIDGQPSAEQLDLVRKGLVGSLFNLTGAAVTRAAQLVAVTDSRLRIPLIFGQDVTHGYRTIFPIPLGESASWDPDAVEAAARVAAREAAAAGVHWTFAPMVDIARDPRWGRIAEGSGEDPYLGAAMAAARVRSFQGAEQRSSDAVLATVKHFAVYGGAEGGRDYNTVDLSERTLREVYQPPYRAAIDAGAGSVMTSFNEIGGIPSTASTWLMTTLLRREWGFKGFVVSDWTAINELLNHGVAASRADAGKLALEAGVDMDMVSRIYVDDVPTLVRAGRIPVSVVNEAVRRVLRGKVALGLFDDPYHGASPERERAALLAPEHRQLARRVAEESIVLLKNDSQLLPLGARVHSIAVIGPLADDKTAALGSWPGRGEPQDAVTPLEGTKARAGSGVGVGYAKGRGITDPTPAGAAGPAKYTSKYTDLPVTPLFPFGHGLSYTTFSYRDLRLSAPRITPAGTLRASVTVTNTGSREGAEVVQLYVHDEVASVTRPVRALAGFRRVSLKPGEARTVEFQLTAKELGLYNKDMKFVVEPGKFRVFVGGSSVGGLEAEFEVGGAGGVR